MRVLGLERLAHAVGVGQAELHELGRRQVVRPAVKQLDDLRGRIKGGGRPLVALNSAGWEPVSPLPSSAAASSSSPTTSCLQHQLQRRRQRSCIISSRPP